MLQEMMRVKGREWVGVASRVANCSALWANSPLTAYSALTTFGFKGTITNSYLFRVGMQ